MPSDGTFGYGKNGRIAGIATYMGHTPEGVDYTILFNASAGPQAEVGAGAWRKDIIAAIHDTTKGPNIDLFEKCP